MSHERGGSGAGRMLLVLLVGGLAAALAWQTLKARPLVVEAGSVPEALVYARASDGVVNGLSRPRLHTHRACPCRARRHEADLAVVKGTARRLETGPSRITTASIRRGDHMYDGEHVQVATLISSWIAQAVLPAASGDAAHP